MNEKLRLTANLLEQFENDIDKPKFNFHLGSSDQFIEEDEESDNQQIVEGEKNGTREVIDGNYDNEVPGHEQNDCLPQKQKFKISGDICNVNNLW